MTLQRFLRVFGLVLSACLPALSQTAQLSGTILDNQGKTIAGASILVHNEDTGTERDGKTSDAGYYVVAFLEPGRYTITATATGFKPTSFEHVVLETAQKALLNCTLEIGSVQEKVTVQSDVSMLNTTDGSVSTIVDRTFVENLPLNGRSFQPLISLTPGVVTNNPQTAAQVGQTGEFSVNGQRTEANRYTIDGVSANNGTYNFGYGTAGTTGSLPVSSALGTTQSLISVDALQEFRVQSSTYSAEFGRQPGGQFSFLTRSGTNDIHGSAYDFLRNDVFDANNWFNDYYAKPKPALRQQDFGFTLGGPAVIPHAYRGKNRTFFFLSYEGLRLKQPLAATPVYVPSQTLREQAPDALKPVLSAFPFVPTASGKDIGNGLATFVLSDSLPSTVNSTSLRLDHNVASWLRLFFRGSYAPSSTASRNRSVLQTTGFETQFYTFGATSPIFSKLVNEFRFSYSPNEGTSIASLDAIGGAKPTDLFTLEAINHEANPNALAYVLLNFPGYLGAINSGATTQRQHQWNTVDTTSYAVGHHLLKVGLDYLRTSSAYQRSSPDARVYFDNATNLLNNISYTSTVAVNAWIYPEYTNFSAFVQDEWHPISQMTLSFGVRWEINPPPSATRGTLPPIIQGDLTDPRSFHLSTPGAPLWDTSYHDFAPRLGVAYLVRQRPGRETVVRAGTGIFFDTGQQGSAFGLSNGPGSFQQANYGTAFGSAASFPLTASQLAVSLAGSLVPPYPTTYTYPINLQAPYTTQWSASLEQAFGKQQGLTISYVGNGGRKLLQKEQVVASKLNPQFASVIIVSNGLTSSYNALQLEFRRRLSGGLQALASYTWSHSIDYASQNTSLPYQRGDADYDLRQNLTAAISYTTPPLHGTRILDSVLGKWSIDGRFNARSGFPLTLQGSLVTDPNTGQQFYTGLNLVQDVPLHLSAVSLPGGTQINPKAFSLPTGNLQGTAPRNFLRGFGTTQVDLALRRDFRLSEHLSLQMRGEAFNVLNHPAFGLINVTYGNALFGQATSTVNTSLGGATALYQQGGPRSLQFAAKLIF